MEENCKLILGDCLKEIPKLKDNSIDLCLTDPPYGLEFMGKKWDKWTDSFTEKWATALYPKLKPGAFLAFTMTPRQDLLWRCLAGIEKAGYELNTSGMFWLYHTGFPKALDVSKAIDKQKGLKGKIVGKSNRNDRLLDNVEAGFFKQDEFGGRKETRLDIIEPESKEARKWQGWKSFQLKPAVEAIVVAQKPRNQKTIVGQVLENGCGAVNIQKCRIPTNPDVDDMARKVKRKVRESKTWEDGSGFKNETNTLTGVRVEGRFPANLLVSGEPLKGYSKSGSMSKEHNASDMGKGAGYPCYGTFKGEGKISKDYHASSGSPNRFYSLDAWAEKRNITLTRNSAFFDVTKPSKAEKNEGLDGFEEKKKPLMGEFKENLGRNTPKSSPTPRANFHPTCKPVTLFCYLATLFCQKHGTILDPFMGSGTTAIAALQENKKFIGIEKDPEYFKIAKARIKPHQEQQRL